MAYLDTAKVADDPTGMTVHVDLGKTGTAAEVADLPFYKTPKQ